MIGPDGTRWPNRVRYEEIVPQECMVYVIDDDEVGDFRAFRSTAVFDLGDATRVSMRVVFDSPETREEMFKFGALEGGKSHLECLEEHVAAMARHAD